MIIQPSRSTLSEGSDYWRVKSLNNQILITQLKKIIYSFNVKKGKRPPFETVY
jgi:hypothetical protein